MSLSPRKVCTLAVIPSQYLTRVNETGIVVRIVPGSSEGLS